MAFVAQDGTKYFGNDGMESLLVWFWEGNGIIIGRALFYLLIGEEFVLSDVSTKVLLFLKFYIFII